MAKQQYRFKRTKRNGLVQWFAKQSNLVSGDWWTNEYAGAFVFTMEDKHLDHINKNTNWDSPDQWSYQYLPVLEGWKIALVWDETRDSITTFVTETKQEAVEEFDAYMFTDPRAIAERIKNILISGDSPERIEIRKIGEINNGKDKV